MRQKQNPLSDPFAAGAGAGPAIHGERRQITACFYDLVNSTGMSEALDPEDFKAIIETFTHCCIPIAGRYGGYTYDTRGDGILVLFGYPSSQGDDAERAIRAAIDTIDTLKTLVPTPNLQLQVRIGIATGLTAVDAAGGHPIIVGETLNMASRLQGIAEPNSIVVSALTKQLAGNFFRYVDLGTHSLKGFSKPVQAWRVVETLRVASRFYAIHSQTPSQFVGRRKEMKILRGLWRRAKAGSGQVVALAGEAGIGKSRLIMQMKEILSPEAEIVEYLCSPYHTNSALYPVIECLRRSDIAGSGNPNGQVQQYLKKKIQLHGSDWQDQLPWLVEMLLPFSKDRFQAVTPQERKRRTLKAILWFLSTLAESGPVLLIVEDAHWIDPTSLELVKMIVEQIKTLRVLLILSFRPASGQVFLDLPQVHRLALERLAKTDAVTLVKNVAGGKTVPVALLDRIVERTDGVPLFLEELTKMALESDIIEERSGAFVLKDNLASPRALPATLQESLAARLDQLGPVKPIAQIASVIGREFSYPLLSAISPLPNEALKSAMQHLSKTGLIFGTNGRTNPTYSFKHSMVRDAAYESLLKADRRMLHERIAGVLEQQALRGEELEPELLAHHCSEAALVSKAAQYWTLAARRALERSANLEVIGHGSRALGELAKLPNTKERTSHELSLRLMLGAAFWAVRGFATPDVEQTFARARDLATEGDHRDQLVAALRGLFGCYYARGQLSKALQQADEVVALAHQSEDSADLCVGRLLRGQILFWQGQFLEARDQLRGALSLYDLTVQHAKMLSSQIDPAINARIHLGWTLWMLGYPDQALRSTEDAVSAARSIAQPFGLAMALFWNTLVQLYRGDRDAANETRRELRATTAEYHLSFLGTCATVLEGEALIASGHAGRGIARIREALADFRSHRAGLGWPWAISLTVVGCLREAKIREGLAALDEAFAAMRQDGERALEAELYRLKGELLCSGKDPDFAEARGCFAQAADIANRQAARSLVLRAVNSQAHLCLATGQGRQIGRSLRDLYLQFTEGLQTTDLIDARNLLGRLDISL